MNSRYRKSNFLQGYAPQMGMRMLIYTPRVVTAVNTVFVTASLAASLTCGCDWL
jgi:hypothetical protein